jgi:hypothetical protein
MEEFDLTQDPRIISEKVKNYPKCKNCGKPYGNVAFGTMHICGRDEKNYTWISNYEPETEIIKTH